MFGFCNDVHDLIKFTAFEEPPEIDIQASSPNDVYIVGDKSSAGFRLYMWIEEGKIVDIEFGRWTQDVSNKKLSNFREGANLVIQLKRIVKCRRIQNELKY